MTEAARILVTEDEEFTRRLIAAYLEKEGYVVCQAASGREMHARLNEARVDLILLDLNLPDEDGLVLARQVRARSTVPIIMLSVRGDDLDKITGLDLGADDYMAKPCNPRELAARVHALLRRSRWREGEAPAGAAEREQRYVTFGGFRLDLEGHGLSAPGGEPVPLTMGEFRILAALARAKGRTLTRNQLLDALAEGPDPPMDRTIDVLISRLRRKIEADGRPALIRTVTGVGYQLCDV